MADLQDALAHFNTDKHQWYGWKDSSARQDNSNIKLKDVTMSSIKIRKSDNESNTSSSAGPLPSSRSISSPRSDNRQAAISDYEGGISYPYSGSSSGDNFYTAHDNSTRSSSRSRPSSADVEVMLSLIHI